jgi:spermidine/putrescine transport system permease protein
MYVKILRDSIIIAFLSTLLCLLIGYPLAYFISRLPQERRSLYLILVIVPTWLNFLLRTYSWMNLLSNNGIINKLLTFLGFPAAKLMYNNGAIFLGMVYNFLPFMIYPIFSVLIKIKPSYYEAAKDLGASNWLSFWRITIPLSVPGIITGITMVFMPAVSTFVIPELLGGGQKMYIGNLIQHEFLQKGDWNLGSAISMIMMVLIFISMWVMNKFDATTESESAIW